MTSYSDVHFFFSLQWMPFNGPTTTICIAVANLLIKFECYDLLDSIVLKNPLDKARDHGGWIHLNRDYAFKFQFADIVLTGSVYCLTYDSDI